MKILMIGLGSIGQRHLRNLKRVYGDEFEILAYRTRRLQQTFSDALQIRDGINLESEYGLKVFTDIDEALAEQPDIAYVTNITSKHMETAITCARVGCNLFIEKPLSNTLNGIEELKRIVEEKNNKIFMGFQNRYHVCIKEAKKKLHSGVLGALQSASVEFSERLTTMHTYEDYRQTYMAKSNMGGGPVLNLQIHDLDLLHYLFGEPEEVTATIYKNSQLEVDVEDGASAIFTFKNGNGDEFPAFSHTDFFQYPPVHVLKIVGEKGRIEIDMNKASFRLIVDGSIVEDLLFSEFQRNDMFVEELKDFINCIKNDTLPVIDLDQGIVSLKMAIGAKLSSQKKEIMRFKEI